MVKEYIDKMLEENEEELRKVESQMQELLKELEYEQVYLATIKREKNVEKNIFSPRNYDFESDIKMDRAKEKVNKIKNEIEYTRERIETFVKKKKDYQILLEEVNTERKENDFETVDSRTETDINKENKKTETVEMLGKDQLLLVLGELYKKTEKSLALLNSDRNKCKSELRGIMKILKDTAAKVENTDKS